MKTCENCKYGWWVYQGNKYVLLCDKFWAGNEYYPANHTVEVCERVAKEGCEDCRNWKRKNKNVVSKEQKKLF